jgi:hypothetical protein
MTFTHFRAQVPVGIFPLYGAINDANALMFVHGGNTPSHVTAEKQSRADNLCRLLRDGKIVRSGGAVIYPITAEEYRRQGGRQE